MVVVAGGQQDHVEAGGTSVGGHAEPEPVAVERERAVEVGDAQVDVADAHGRMDGFGWHAAQCPASRPPAASVYLPIRAPPDPGDSAACTSVPAGRQGARTRGDRGRAAGAAGAGRVVAIEGEPGIGKSRLLAHLVARPPSGAARCSARARRSSSATSRTRSGAKRSTHDVAARRRDRHAHALGPLPRACSQGAGRTPRPAGRSGWTTCSGPIPRRSTRWRRWCAGRPPRRCCSRSRRAKGRCRPPLAAALAGAHARTASSR